MESLGVRDRERSVSHPPLSQSALNASLQELSRRSDRRWDIRLLLGPSNLPCARCTVWWASNIYFIPDHIEHVIISSWPTFHSNLMRFSHGSTNLNNVRCFRRLSGSHYCLSFNMKQLPTWSPRYSKVDARQNNSRRSCMVRSAHDMQARSTLADAQFAKYLGPG